MRHIIFYSAIVIFISFSLNVSSQHLISGFGEHSDEEKQDIDTIRTESVFIHTDRDIYIAGENLYFSFYLLNPYHYEGLKPSTTAYIEIINSDNSQVAHIRSEIENQKSYNNLLIPDTLSSGRYILRAYTRHMMNFGPDIYMHKEIFIYNPFNAKLSPITEIDSDEGQDYTGIFPISENHNSGITGIFGEDYQTREEINIELQLDTGLFNNTDLSLLSASVSVSPVTRGLNISDLLNSETDRSINKPKESWSGPGKYYHKELYGPYLEGTVINKSDLSPVCDTYLYLSLPGKSTQFQYSVTDNYGAFRFILPVVNDRIEYIIQPSDFGDDQIIKITSPFANDLHYSFNSELPDNAYLHLFASRLGINYQINRIYEIYKEELTQEEESIPEYYDFYGEPDIRIDLDDYIDLPEMEEVFHELVPGVSIRRQDKQAVIQFGKEGTGAQRSIPDAVFLDGVIIDDHSIIADLDPELIERIDVIKRSFRIGDLILNGIVSIRSVNVDLCGLDYPNSGIRSNLKISANNNYCQYNYHKDLSTRESYIPDFRNTLFWDPELKADSSGIIKLSFRTSDFISDYSLIIQGITDKNIPVYFEHSFRVKK